MRDLILYDHRSSICSQMARLALVEKGLSFTRRQIDIMDTNEQFEDWYIALNPRAVVPTLKIGDEVVTDTIRIVNRVQSMAGPDLAGDATTQAWLTDIMALHYGVLMYRNRIDETGTAPQIVARGRLLNDMLKQRPDLSDLIAKRLEGNRRFQALLKSPSEIETHLETARALVGRLNDALHDNAQPIPLHHFSDGHRERTVCMSATEIANDVATAVENPELARGIARLVRGQPVDQIGDVLGCAVAAGRVYGSHRLLQALDITGLPKEGL